MNDEEKSSPESGKEENQVHEEKCSPELGENSNDGDDGSSDARINIRWIAVGAIALWAMISFGQFAITQFVIAEDPELTSAFNKLSEHQERARSTADTSDDELSDEKKSRYRSVFLGSGSLVFGMLAMVLLAPLLVAFLVSRFSGLAKDGAIAVMAGVLIASIQEGILLVGAISLPFYFGLGLLAGLLGRKLHRRSAV